MKREKRFYAGMRRRYISACEISVMQQKLYDAEVVRMKDMLGKQSGDSSASGTIEEKILKLQETKQDLAESVLSGGSSIADLSNEELMELLG